MLISQNVLISPYNGLPVFIIRIDNSKSKLFHNNSAKMLYS